MTDREVEEVTVADLVRLGAGHGFRVVDVREQEEWDEGRIAGATLIPLSEFEGRWNELDPAAPTLLVCRSGRRSLTAAKYLLDQGFTRPVNLADGMLAWEAMGQPIEQ